MRWRCVIFSLLLDFCLYFSGFAQNLCPDAGVLQYAGNIGMFSAGPVWCYGKSDRWETHLLFGFVPGKNGVHGATTFTLKEQFCPWNIDIMKFSVKKYETEFTPALFNISYNVITGKSFWHSHGKNHNKYNYYQFSSRSRLSVGIGSRIGFGITDGCNKRLRRVSFYYEFSTYDLAIRSAICNKTVGLSDIISLGVGIQIRFL